METPQVKQLFQSLLDNLSQNAIIKKVYGEPIETQGKTIITVAKVSMGFGGGFGGKKRNVPNENKPTEQPEEGGGLGGGLSAKPYGIIEITPTQTRFIRFGITRYIVLGAVLSLTIGLISKRNRRKHYPPAV